MQTAIDEQYILDADGQSIAVIVPMALWHEIASERETVYRLSTDNMKRRLLAARERTTGVSLEDVP